MVIQIHTISKPDRWYSQFVGYRFNVEPALFGYRVSSGKYKGMLIYRRDCFNPDLSSRVMES